MTRYRGRIKLKLIERDFTHHVELIVPEGGFGNVNDMHEWHRTRGIRATRGTSQRDGNNCDL